MKSFRQLIVENEKEFSYTIKSTADIHTPQRLQMIKWAAQPHQCLGVEASHRRVAEKSNKDFPDLPDSPCYVVNVYTGLEVDPRVLEQEVKRALNFQGLNLGRLKVEGAEKQDDEADDVFITGPGNTTPADTFKHDTEGDAQKLVGAGRLGDFLREIEKDRKDAEKDIETWEVYETYAVPYSAVQTLVGEPVRKGFWLVETTAGAMYIDGPFAAVPSGVPFCNKVLNEGRVAEREKLSGIERIVVTAGE